MKIETLEQHIHQIRIRHPTKINYYHEARQNIAATVIQTAWRGWSARLKVKLLKLERKELGIRSSQTNDAREIEAEQLQHHVNEWSDDMIEFYVRKIRSNVSPNAELFTSRKYTTQQCNKLDELMKRKHPIPALSHPSNLSKRVSQWVSLVELSLTTRDFLEKEIPPAPALDSKLDPPVTDAIKLSHRVALKQASEGWWKHVPTESIHADHFEFDSWIKELENGIVAGEDRYF